LFILYLGSEDGTCLDRANALRRLGHRVEHIDLRRLLPNSKWIDRVIWKLGGHLFGALISKMLPPRLHRSQYDLIYVDGGDLVTPGVIRVLRRFARRVINYNIDDPTGNRDASRWYAYRRSLPHYDLCFVLRSENLAEAKQIGARRICRVYMSADEISHAPRIIHPYQEDIWSSEVLFLGTWFPERGPFLLSLINRGIPLTIRGSNWHKAPEWSQLRPHWKGYALAIQCAKVNLGLLSKGNRDLHTTRSFEIPALGALLCAERTPEHAQLYQEDTEALFWSNEEECAAKCRYALADEGRRKRIAAAGHTRCLRNESYNEPTMRHIISQAFAVEV
jgi:spore maturation protein CgeB